MSSSDQQPPEKSKLPSRNIPGDYGLPFFGAIRDRFDYFYNQGPDNFFRSRVQKYKSTVFRTNMPPGPFMALNPRVVTVLDAVSFPILFDTSKVEKKNILDGTFMPSTAFTGGYRACAFLDPSEPKHAALKGIFLSYLAKLHDKNIIPLFRSCLSHLLDHIDNDVSSKGRADFNSLSNDMSFDFVFRMLSDNYSSEAPKLRASADKWLTLQLAPLATLGIKYLPNFLEDLMIHTFPLPFFLVKSEYKRLFDAFKVYASSFLDEAEKAGIERDEACHNLVFLAEFNAYGGMRVLFPALIKWVGLSGEELHRQLVHEIRTVVKEEGRSISFRALDRMTLTKSVVYEALRIEPPVPFQYGKAKEDIVVHNHSNSFSIKKGEMIFGYQPFATKDPMVFEDPEAFVGDRFVGDGEKLIKYIYWSNGREIHDPTVDNKQCPAKDLVVLLSRLMLVEFFLRYDTYTVEIGKLFLGSSATIKSVTKSNGQQLP